MGRDRAAVDRGDSVLRAHCRGEPARGRQGARRGRAGDGRRAASHRAARAAAGGVAGHRRRLHDHGRRADRLDRDGGCGRRGRARRSCDPLRLPAFRYGGDGDGDRDPDRARHRRAVHRRSRRAAAREARVSAAGA
ncbi:putative methionine transport protein, ABC transport, inner membrane component [Burkholderia pseudomallei]|nr:putative methionine transport protein, ABC transport, inner membrane component [Burkholderia pseudomallei]